jgi:repressor of nif and glnA expression
MTEVPSKKAVLDYIRNNTPISANQINRHLRVGKRDRRTIRYWLKQLIEEGKIVRKKSLKDAQVELYLPSD